MWGGDFRKETFQNVNIWHYLWGMRLLMISLYFFPEFSKALEWAFSSFVIMREMKVIMQIDWCKKRRKWSKGKHHCLSGKQGEGEACGWPAAGTVGCLAMEPSLAWVSHVPSSRQNTHLLSPSVARSGRVMCFWPVRHEQNSIQDCGKQLLLCFPFIPALKNVYDAWSWSSHLSTSG